MDNPHPELLRVDVPGDRIALVAIGGIGNVHEANLWYDKKRPRESSQLSPSLAQLFAMGAKRGPNDDDDDNSEMDMYEKRWDLIPVLAGTWMAARIKDGAGAVLWHEETIGSSCVQDVARVIYSEICDKGRVGMYNADHTTMFWVNGGRVIHRMSWYDTAPKRYRLNHMLAQDEPMKLADDELETFQGVAPSFLFAPASLYRDKIFPNLSSIAEGSHGFSAPAEGSCIWCSFAGQEYLAGRYLTTTIDPTARGMETVIMERPLKRHPRQCIWSSCSPMSVQKNWKMPTWVTV